MTLPNPGSYMEVGDIVPYRPETTEHFFKVQLAAVENETGILARNARLAHFVKPAIDSTKVRAYSFFPPALAPESEKVILIDAIKTGGRTFLLTHESAKLLHLPPVLHLNLKQLGWGSGYVQLRPEIKGAGCCFEQTAVNLKKLSTVLRGAPALRDSFRRYTPSPARHPVIFSSHAEIESRSAGTQTESFGTHAVKASSLLLGTTKLKFIPSWECVRQPNVYLENLEIVSRALEKGCPRCTSVPVTEVRYTAGSVRAVYFENARTDQELRLLCSRVSADKEGLIRTLPLMIEDCRHYLELLAASTKHEQEGGYCWTKVGDISLEFRTDSNGRNTKALEYKNIQRRAWYLAKDEIIVGGLGKFFLDMESFRAGSARYRARDIQELLFQHELFVLNVLRDHARVCVQFLIGMEEMQRRVSWRERIDMQHYIVAEILAAVNLSSQVQLRLCPNSVETQIYYPNLRREQSYRFVRGQIGERY